MITYFTDSVKDFVSGSNLFRGCLFLMIQCFAGIVLSCFMILYVIPAVVIIRGSCLHVVEIYNREAWSGA